MLYMTWICICGLQIRHADHLHPMEKLNYFKTEHAPEGCTDRCLEGCKAKDNCIFDAEKIYLDHKRIGYRNGNREWPLDVIVPSGPTEDKIEEALRTGPYGRCVFRCDNNVVDHQVINMNMTDGTTMSFYDVRIYL